MKTIKEMLLDESRKLICGDRQDAYGSAKDSFNRIAEFWSTYLDKKLTGLDVAQMMTLLKVSRSTTSPKKMDNYIDGIGYQALAGELADSEDKK